MSELSLSPRLRKLLEPLPPAGEVPRLLSLLTASSAFESILEDFVERSFEEDEEEKDENA